jgi:hypothetical protein
LTAIGYVTKNDNGSYKGQLKTISIREPSLQNGDKSDPTDLDLKGLYPRRRDRHGLDLAS